MRRTLAVALATLLALSVLGLTGCQQIQDLLHDPTVDANAAIQKANASLKNFAASDAKVQTLAADLNTIEVTPAGAKRALEVIASLRTELDTQRAELQSARTSLGLVKKLEVKDEFKKYADLEVALIDTRLAVVDEGGKLYDQMELMYTAVRDKKLTPALSRSIPSEIDTIANTIAALSEKAATESKAAAAYFKTQKLGGE